MNTFKIKPKQTTPPKQKPTYNHSHNRFFPGNLGLSISFWEKKTNNKNPPKTKTKQKTKPKNPKQTKENQTLQKPTLR